MQANAWGEPEGWCKGEGGLKLLLKCSSRRILGESGKGNSCLQAEVRVEFQCWLSG